LEKGDRYYLMELMYCPECGNGPVIEDLTCGEFFCRSCGYVFKENVIDSSPDWRVFTKEEMEEKVRGGMPPSLAIHDMGLSTVFDGDRDVSGRRFTYLERKRALRMRTLDRRSSLVPLHRNLLLAFTDLYKLADKLNVSNSVVEGAAYIYRKALKNNLIKGRSISAIIAASLYAACRETNTPRTLNDVTKASEIKRKDVTRCYRLLLKELGLKMPVVDSLKCISRIANKARIPERTSRKALEILNEAKGQRISAGKDPMALAATALYISCVHDGVSKTQKEIAHAAGITEVTIRNRCKDLNNIVKVKIF